MKEVRTAQRGNGGAGRPATRPPPREVTVPENL